MPSASRAPAASPRSGSSLYSSIHADRGATLLSGKEPLGKHDGWDINLHLCSERTQPGTTSQNTFYLHRSFLRKSPYLVRILQLFPHVQRIEVLSSPGFNCPHAVYLAIQALYGYPLLDRMNVRQRTLEGFKDQDITGESFNIEIRMVDFVICYAVSGVFLDRGDISGQGIKLLVDMLNMENVEYMLRFALYPDYFFLQSPLLPCGLANYAGTMIESYSTEHIESFKAEDTRHLLTKILRFIGSRIPENFPLFTGYFDADLITRIPYDLRTLPDSAVSNYRLAHMHFGELLSLKQHQPDHSTLIKSVILLNVPFECLQVIIEEMKSNGTLSPTLLDRIVQVREKLRLHALRYHERVKDEIADPFIDSQHMGFREYVVGLETRERANGQNVSLILSREFVGFRVVEPRPYTFHALGTLENPGGGQRSSAASASSAAQ
ncbi:hypothetical protein N7468_005522 [Penicillium chermesinum]|uniref:BTB domain-containing protein n=1 Tax=Penicillium chermesinum TaxID=63820 RepID=A0A9W9TN24_9EURO|nr:uncharacterized protein N7468_005522 [Penicillium chermesinum]KAJ5232566.1 hypothetical protein N7468_005522 [Penicillium chermesinum]KAJ6172222.1 hypothetical protein N7470_001289 [Penicillium chermesinum]